MELHVNSFTLKRKAQKVTLVFDKPLHHCHQTTDWLSSPSAIESPLQ